MTISTETPADPAPQGAAALFGADGAEGQSAPAAPPADATAPSASWWDGDAFKVSTDKAGDALSDSEWLANKKFPTFEDMVKSARSLESKLGADRVPVPKGPEDAEGWTALKKAIGVPDDPKGYELKLADGYDEGFVGAFRDAAHQIGLAPHQAQQLAEWFEGTAASDAATNAEKAANDLKAEWKGDYKANLEHARRAMGAFGLSPDDLNALSVGYGLANTMQLFAKLGGRMGEDNGLPGGGGGAAAQSLDQLQMRKQEILSSRELQEKLRAGDPGLKAEWQKITEAEIEAAKARR